MQTSTSARIRHNLKLSGTILVIAAVAIIATAAALARPIAPQTPAQAPKASGEGDATRGEYLANRVAMCVQCHSPRDAHGNLIEGQHFRGGAIPVSSPYPNRQWAFLAPNISNLPGFTDDQIIMLLTEGHAGDRPSPKPPMPPFRMSQEDAKAIIAYLRSR
jgi:mono/diheme cytochrome c family protein